MNPKHISSVIAGEYNQLRTQGYYQFLKYPRRLALAAAVEELMQHKMVF